MNFQQLKKIASFYVRFAPSFTQVGYLVRKPFWRRLRPDFSGQHWVVTGSSGGIGRYIVLAAARAGATVTAVARNPDKLAQLEADARAVGLMGIDTEVCDLALQRDTARLVERFCAANRKISVLVNNVGVLLDDHSVTPEGRETSFATNILNHYLLTEGLIRCGAFMTESPLVLNMTSGGGYNVPLATTMMNVVDPQKYSGVLSYGFHKRGQISLNHHWRARHGDRGMEFYVMHPGWADTEGVKRSLPRFRRIFKPILRNDASGADTAIWLAAARPKQAEHEHVWFDRKQRPVHVFSRTRLTKETPDSLATYLEAELARNRDALPWT